MSEFKNSHVVVTGGNRGIGAAIATRFHSLGASLSIMARNEELLSKFGKSLGDEVCCAKVDVCDPEQVRDGFAKAVETHGKVDILINNAGAVDSKPFTKTSLEDWDKTINVNLRGVYLCIQQVLPTMLAKNSGRIVNIASTAGLKAYPYVAAYCAAKHAVVGLTRALALETAKSEVLINAICPGFTETDLLKNAANEVADKTGRPVEEIKKEFLSSVPQNRFVSPEEIASAAVWLCSNEQRSVRGQTIVVDGAETL